MASALFVSGCLLNLADTEEPEADSLNPMRLQKLLYYAQGWSLAERGRPLFPEAIQAWAYGPVVPEVYHRFKHYKAQSIAPGDVKTWTMAPAEELIVRRVWEAYKPFSAIQLFKMTHREAPWREARAGLSEGAHGSNVITKESMRRFFSERKRS